MKKSTFMITALFLAIILGTPAHAAIEDYVGAYSGTYSGGGDDGYWVALVAGINNVRFLAWSNADADVDGGEIFNTSEVPVLEILDITGNSEIKGASVSISITLGNGNVQGTYTNGGSSGSITGSRQASVSTFAGSYSGSFTGSDTGTWSVSVDSYGYISGTVTSNSYGSYGVVGGVNDSGVFICYDDLGVGITGTISGASVSGSWDNSATGDSGTISSSTGGGGGGGGGGCFLNALWMWD